MDEHRAVALDLRATLSIPTDKSSVSPLYLPHLLPCPGPGRCDFHTGIFGRPFDEVKQTWWCARCQKKHPTCITTRTSIASTSSRSLLELLPTELLQHVLEHLPLSSEAALAFTSHTLCEKVGTRSWSIQGQDRSQLVTLLARDTPTYATCTPCAILRPCYSPLAWPLLKSHREERGIPESVYVVSEFLAIKVAQAFDHQREHGPCASLLTCAGTYRKPWAKQEKAFVEKIGFSQEDFDLGLAITYEASGRLYPGGAQASNKLITHVQYRIMLPRSWTSFTVAQRFTVLRKFYLCPHTYASKVQYRDPKNPDFPSDSSIIPWLPDQGPIPEGLFMCSECPTEFRSRAESDDTENKHSIIFDVWRESIRACNDGISEATFCSTSNLNILMRLGRIKGMFAGARPI